MRAELVCMSEHMVFLPTHLVDLLGLGVLQAPAPKE